MQFDLDSANTPYIEQLYEQYKKDPGGLDERWQAFFKGFELGIGQTPADPSDKVGSDRAGEDGQTSQAYALVQAYRQLGHFIANLDPLGHKRDDHPLLALTEFGLSEADLDKEVGKGGFLGNTENTLRDLLAKLRTTYCRTLGVEYTSIADKAQRDWIQQRIEPVLNRPKLAPEQCHRLLASLVAAEEFEKFLHTRYIGQKRFSIEGGEALIPLLENLVERGAELEAGEMVIGMAHRGRLNVLAHLLKKPYEVILGEFEGAAQNASSEEEGDVKYHLGYSHDFTTAAGHKVHLSLSSNPSHLELVNPVIEGIVRAKQSHLGDEQRRRVVPVLVHGEAAFTGQGIVAEAFNLSQLEGYQVGGTIHVIINNQLGYTATSKQTRFTTYPTDVAKQVDAPVFHVNANDPEAVAHAAQMAIEFRQEFRRDVLIDLWCYRRYGHNESDDPTFTQPLMYQEIDKLPTVCHLYAWESIAQNKITPEAIDEIRQEVRDKLEDAQRVARALEVQPQGSVFGGLWKGLEWAGDDWSADTAVSAELIAQVGRRATEGPPGFKVNRTLRRIMAARREMVTGEQPVDWGCGEMLAFGSLLLEGFPVRLAGQDSQRGTFAHRHAVWHDVETGKVHVPLEHLDPNQGKFHVLNTMLSELAVVGFEYGISSADPGRLVIWEAQFGDFVNGAQLVIDQYISSGETKWRRMSGLVMLLPHGYEGMGPEHSSARLERFLQACAKGNMQVCYPTVPAQLFHVLRRQLYRNFRKPLILMTPKSLLRHKECVSSLEDFTTGKFQTVIDDESLSDRAAVRRVILCSGKIYFDLAAERPDQDGGDQTALVRVEQLYPFPDRDLLQVLDRFPKATEVYWVQEEAYNMGAWSFVQPRLLSLIGQGKTLVYVGRDQASSPATGLYQVHLREQQEIVDKAFASRAVAVESGAARPAVLVEAQEGQVPRKVMATG